MVLHKIFIKVVTKQDYSFNFRSIQNSKKFKSVSKWHAKNKMAYP